MNNYAAAIQVEVDIVLSNANGFNAAARTKMMTFLTPGDGLPADGGITGLVDPLNPEQEESYGVQQVIDANVNYKNAVGSFRNTIKQLSFFALNVAIVYNTTGGADGNGGWPVGTKFYKTMVTQGGTNPLVENAGTIDDFTITLARVATGVFSLVPGTVGAFTAGKTFYSIGQPVGNTGKATIDYGNSSLINVNTQSIASDIGTGAITGTNADGILGKPVMIEIAVVG